MPDKRKWEEPATPAIPGKPVYLEVFMDFDKTLGEYCEHPLFRRCGVDPVKFWVRNNEWTEQLKAGGYNVGTGEIGYMTLMIRCARGLEPEFRGMKGLNNRMLRESGEELETYPGVPTFIDNLKSCLEGREEWRNYNIRLGFHVASTGLTEVILGNELAKHLSTVTGHENRQIQSVHGSQFIEEDGVIAHPILLDPYSKGRVIYQIAKGGLDLLNVDVPIEKRRSLKRNFLVLGDGPSDKAAFSVAHRYGGRGIGVFDPANKNSIMQVHRLHEEGVINHMCPADFTPGGATLLTMEATLMGMAERVIEELSQQSVYAMHSAPTYLEAPVPKKVGKA
ncbi:MAG: hypothetical protein HY362_04250 [Candidatus Aenigmarchaeota archaeon]|nr:hypothetical protein [Candidatus Aenigmarchaeota archaeon]